MELLAKANAVIKSDKRVELTSKRMTVNGESVNNIPASFKGVVQLPNDGVEGNTYDWGKVVESTETYSRITADIEGVFQKNGKSEELKSKSAALWGGAINVLQKKAAIVMDGEAVFAVLN